MVKYIVKGLT